MPSVTNVWMAAESLGITEYGCWFPGKQKSRVAARLSLKLSFFRFALLLRFTFFSSSAVIIRSFYFLLMLARFFCPDKIKINGVFIHVHAGHLDFHFIADTVHVSGALTDQRVASLDRKRVV